MKINLAKMKFNLAEMKFNLAEMKFNLAQMKINVAEMKINVAEMKFNLAEMKINLAEMKFNLTLIKLISGFLLAVYYSLLYIIVLLVRNNINMYIYSDLIGDPIFRPNIMETPYAVSII